MATFYPYLKLFHILLAVVAVGYNLAYGPILMRLAKAPREVQKFGLETVRGLDRIANWAYTLLLITGGGMVTAAHYSWGVLWTAGSAALLIVMMGLAHGLYTPTLKKQIKALDAGGPESAEYQALTARGNNVGMVLMLLALAIVALMVLKL